MELEEIAKLTEGMELVLKVVPMPKDVNVNGDIFGGWVMSHVDIAGSVLAAHHTNARLATVAVNEFIFKQPVQVGDVLSFYAKTTKVGRTSLGICVEVIAERRGLPSTFVKVTQATLTYVAIDEAGRSRPL